MAQKKNSFVTAELEFAESQLREWKQYVEDHPISGLMDRVEWKATARGGSIPMVIASIEQQGKFLQETMKNYLSLLEVVDKLREREEAKVETRGKTEISHLAKGFLDKKIT